MKRLLPCIGLIIFLSTSLVWSLQQGDASQTSNAERRIALVIGNTKYPTGRLTNPVNDATDMADALRSLGFKVTLKLDASQKEMIRAIQSFGDDLQAGGVGMFFYSGHGAQVNGENYLVPVDANIRREEELEYESVNARRVIAAGIRRPSATTT